MQRKELTDALIASLTPKRKRQLVYDSEVRSLAVSMSPKGKKTFVVVKRLNGAKHASRRRLGIVGRITIPHARELAIKADMRRTDKFGDVAESYFEHIAKQRRATEVERTIRRELLPSWQSKPIGTITKADVRSVVNAIKARGRLGAARHVFSYAGRLFNWAAHEDLIEHSPCLSLDAKTLLGERVVRDRVLTDDELRALWRACVRRGHPFGTFAQLLIVTGQRRADVAFAQRREFDLDERLWEIPAARFKSNRKHLVPLSPLAIDLLKSIMSDDPDSRVLQFNDFSKAKVRLDKLMLAELRKRNAKAELLRWTYHDLRRTMRTRLTPLTTYEVAEAVLGHSKTGLDKTYNLYQYLDEKRQALDAWSARLSGIVSDSQRKSP
jgi:integrase